MFLWCCVSPGVLQWRYNDTALMPMEDDSIISVSYDDGHWSVPYFDCGGGYIWMMTYTVPFFGYKNGTFKFKWVPHMYMSFCMSVCLYVRLSSSAGSFYVHISLYPSACIFFPSWLHKWDAYVWVARKCMSSVCVHVSLFVINFVTKIGCLGSSEYHRRIFLSLCPYVYLFVCLSILATKIWCLSEYHRSFCLTVCPYDCLFIFLSILATEIWCLSVCQYHRIICLSVSMSFRSSVYRSFLLSVICMPNCLSILSICLSIGTSFSLSIITLSVSLSLSISL